MKIVEFTVNIGNYDPVRQDLANINNYNLFRNNARNSRCIKILAHKFVDADVSIYYDSHVKCKAGITKEMIVENYLGDGDICIIKSKKRVYDEVKAAINRIADTEERNILLAQGEYYKQHGFDNLKVYGYQPLIRRHNKITEQFNESWWAEICKWSYRDQVSFPVILRQFPELRVKFVDLTEISIKMYCHGRKIFPKIVK
jgi:hypothetical protein